MTMALFVCYFSIAYYYGAAIYYYSSHSYVPVGWIENIKFLNNLTTAVCMIINCTSILLMSATVV